MTTINTTEVQARKNIKAVIVGGEVPEIVKYFAEYAEHDADKFKEIKAAVTEALKAVPAFLKAEAADKEARKESHRNAVIAAANKRKEQNDAERARLQAEREKEAAAMLVMLQDSVNGMGLDLEAATLAVNAAMQKKYGKTKTPGKTFERATVSVDGVQYEIPRTGNMTKALKELVQAHGGDRDAFIAKFEVKEESGE